MKDCRTLPLSALPFVREIQKWQMTGQSTSRAMRKKQQSEEYYNSEEVRLSSFGVFMPSPLLKWAVLGFSLHVKEASMRKPRMSWSFTWFYGSLVELATKNLNVDTVKAELTVS